MRLKKITLENFRCFEKLELELHPQMTVLVAENGQGKSTILDAIRIALWPFVGSFDLARTRYSDPADSIAVDDIRMIRKLSHDMARQLPCSIDVSAQLGTQTPESWKRYRTTEEQNTKVVKESGYPIRKHAKDIQTQIRNPEIGDLNLPVFGYYGTCRNCSGKKLTEGSKARNQEKDSADDSDFYIRTFAYRDALNPASSFKHFKDWFRWLALSRAQYVFTFGQSRLGDRTPLGGPLPSSQEERDLTRIDTQIAVVRQAIDSVLQAVTGWHGLAYSHSYEQSLVLQHAEHGIMKVANLSDGIRSMLAMVGDIAYRCIKLNPHLGLAAAEQTEGVVMIDEVDMHLHPGWQQTVLGQLQAAFPNIQFIVTTHSPQVLSSVDAACIRVLKPVTNEEGRPSITVENINQQTKGVASSDLLAEIMGVDPIPNLPEARNLARYHALIQQNLYSSDDGLNLRASLEQHFGASHPVILECERMIRLQAFKQKLPLPQSGPSDKG